MILYILFKIIDFIFFTMDVFGNSKDNKLNQLTSLLAVLEEKIQTVKYNIEHNRNRLNEQNIVIDDLTKRMSTIDLRIENKLSTSEIVREN